MNVPCILGFAEFFWEPEPMECFFDSLVVNVSAYVILYDECYGEVETILLRNLLQENIFAALLAMEVWTLLLRWVKIRFIHIFVSLMGIVNRAGPRIVSWGILYVGCCIFFTVRIRSHFKVILFWDKSRCNVQGGQLREDADCMTETTYLYYKWGSQNSLEIIFKFR